MRRFVGRNFRIVLQAEADFIQTLQQAVAGEFVNLKCCGEAVAICDGAGFEVNGQRVIWSLTSLARDLCGFCFAQNHRENTVLHAIIREDVCKRGSDNGAEAEICECPNRMLS